MTDIVINLAIDTHAKAAYDALRLLAEAEARAGDLAGLFDTHTALRYVEDKMQRRGLLKPLPKPTSVRTH